MNARPTRSRRRRRLRLRHPVPFWMVAIALTALTVSVVSHVTADAVDARDQWGARTLVAVATLDVAPGEEVAAELRAIPSALVPAGALSSLPDGEMATAWIAAGEVVLEARLAPAGLSEVAARLPPGTRGIAVPPGMAPLPVEVGDRVDVLGTGTLASDALVVAVSEAAVTIAVDRDDAGAIAYEVATASVTLVLSGSR